MCAVQYILFINIFEEKNLFLSFHCCCQNTNNKGNEINTRTFKDIQKR